MHAIKGLVKSAVPRGAYAALYSLFIRLRGLSSILYRGDAVECPFCGGRFTRFLAWGLKLPVIDEKRIIGAGFRENALCPRCRSLDRERLLYLYLRDQTRLFMASDKKIRLLHIAPEWHIQRVLSKRPGIDYTSADLSSPTAMVRLDVTAIQFADQSFDAVICNHVLEHIPDDRKAMSEIYRILKPGGFAILQVPIALALEKTVEDPSIDDPKKREELFGQDDHVRVYGKDYAERLRDVGFVVEAVNYALEIGDEAAKRYGLLKDETVFVGVRS
ncbi:MAG TPA: class I SAM-dependent methyltransferase [Spirochaetota bacterium]|nr:class I SAM-dependent methyltransferase [Spirochaetota bacterium]HNT12667.1 class I SAM-dependent methyltransferase [Spirochaetota bacterium]